MKRVIYLKDKNNENKYVLIKEYGGFGIYQHKCPSGLFVNQEYAIVHDGLIVEILSFNQMCLEELLEYIDNFNETKRFGFGVMPKYGYYTMHPSGVYI